MSSLQILLVSVELYILIGGIIYFGIIYLAYKYPKCDKDGLLDILKSDNRVMILYASLVVAIWPIMTLQIIKELTEGISLKRRNSNEEREDN